jgi:hypothetical protein
MGTRGAFGVFSDGTLKMTYNHYDSYPSGLGVQLAEQIADMATRNSQESFRGAGGGSDHHRPGHQADREADKEARAMDRPLPRPRVFHVRLVLPDPQPPG